MRSLDDKMGKGQRPPRGLRKHIRLKKAEERRGRKVAE